jgi:serine/threonine protein phosphatase 1
MATIAIGDVHGNLAALEDLLEQLRGELAKGDVVVFLGDYVDRGPDSRGCIDAILTLQRDGPAEVVCLRGNHEDWLLRTMDDHTSHSWLLSMEGLTTVASYSTEACDALAEALGDAGAQLFLGRLALPYERFFAAMPAEHQRFLRQLAYAYRSSECLCTHAGFDPAVPDLIEQTPHVCIWGHAAFPAGYLGTTPAVYGHWNSAVIDADGWPRPRLAGNTIMLDTIAHGVLSAMRFPDRTLFQSRRTRVRGSRKRSTRASVRPHADRDSDE